MSKIAVAQIESAIVKEENLRTALALSKKQKTKRQK